MTTQSKESRTPLWQLDGPNAILNSSQLTASIDLLRPHLGLSQLVYDGKPLAGSVLGVTPSAAALQPSELQDAFVRGNDLVVTYAATDQRPFSLQVYWRIAINSQKVVLLDSILSLQTDLLESFPGLAIETKIPAERIYAVTDNKGTVAELSLTTDEPYSVETTQPGCLLLRSFQADSSYAEMSYPEDRGELKVALSEDNAYTLRRRLGGAFLEKGVIRRLRVRGLFMPQQNDAKHASECLAALANEQPPLTV